MFWFSNRILQRLAGESAGITDSEIKKILSVRHPFSAYLPYLSYDPELKVYRNKDGTLGYLFVGKPLWGEIREARTNLASLLHSLPEEGVLSVHLISSPHVEPILRAYLDLRSARTDPLVREAAESYVRFLREATEKGIPHCLGIPLRDFWLLVSVKFPEKGIDPSFLREHRASVMESVRRMMLGAADCEPEFLLQLLHFLFNGKRLEGVGYDGRRPISSQVIAADSPVEFGWDRIRLGSGFWGFVTPKGLPAEFHPAVVTELSGPTDGPRSDGKQIPGHFIFTLVVYRSDKVHGEIYRKAGLFGKQATGEGGKSMLGRLIGEYYEEHSRAVTEIETGARFLYAIPVMMIQGSSESECRRNLQRARNLFDEHGFPSQEERGILPVLFLLSLPFGCSLRFRDFSVLDRHFVLKPEEAAGLAPLVGEIQGLGAPAVVFVGRKGQLVTFDPFDHRAPNKNMVVIGSTGGGKSVNLNLIVNALYSSGAAVYIIDLGYSYVKQCRLYGGSFIDFSAEEPVCLNPFGFINEEDPEDVANSLSAISELVLGMIFAGSGEKSAGSGEKGSFSVSKEQRALVRYAVEFAWNEFGKDAGVDHVYIYLAKFPYLCGREIEDICTGGDTAEDLEDAIRRIREFKEREREPEERPRLEEVIRRRREQLTPESLQSSCIPNLREEAQRMAFALYAWTSEGRYGRWFNGRPNMDLSSDFVVLEMEKLKRDPALMAIVTLAVLNAVTASLYLGGREKRKFVLVEECGILLEEAPYLVTMVKEAYRRARKYNGAIATVFQSPYDLHNLGPAAQTITANTAHWLLLPSDQYESIAKDERTRHFGFDEYMAKRLSTVQLVKPRYGELGLKTVGGFGVVRTVMNGFLYYLVTTDPDDLNRIEEKKRAILAELGGGREAEREALARAIRELGEERDRVFSEKFSAFN